MSFYTLLQNESFSQSASVLYIKPKKVACVVSCSTSLQSRYHECLFCVSGARVVLFLCFRLSVQVQSIAWKDSSSKYDTIRCGDFLSAFENRRGAGLV